MQVLHGVYTVTEASTQTTIQACRNQGEGAEGAAAPKFLLKLIFYQLTMIVKRKTITKEIQNNLNS